MQALPTEVITFTLEALPYPVNVVFRPYYFNMGFECGKLEVHHFEFTTDPRFKEFTETGYRSHFAYNEPILNCDSIEAAAMEILLMIVRQHSPAAAVKIQKKQWVPTLF